MEINNLNNLSNWCEDASQYKLPAWEQLSSIPLYMDQVMLFMTEAFKLFENDGKTPILTNSMVTNYVKNGLVDHPQHKKYNREHLAKLVMIGMLKQVLSIQDISVLFTKDQDTISFYNAFIEAQDAALHETVSVLNNTGNDTEELRSAALRLAAEANARRMVAEKILAELSETLQTNETKTKKVQKNK